MADEQIPDDVLKALEREVGDLIAQAESLGNELVREVGQASEAPPPAQAEVLPAAVDVARQLADTVAAVDAAAQELGAEAASPPPKPAKKISLPPKGPVRSAAPPHSDAQGGGGAASEAPASQPAAAAGRPSHTVVLPSKKPASSPPAGVNQLVAAHVEVPIVELPPRRALRERMFAMLPSAHAQRACAACAGVGVGVLEWLDRPFQRIGYGVRQALGWCGFAMLTAAAFIYLFIVR